MKLLSITTVFTVSLCLPSYADVTTCTYEKLSQVSGPTDKDENARTLMGNSFKVDNAKQLIFIEWDRGISGWMKPDKFSKNSSFTAYTFLFEMNVTDAERQNQGVKKVDYKISYRLYSDGASAKVFADAGGNFIPRAASYSCD